MNHHVIILQPKRANPEPSAHDPIHDVKTMKATTMLTDPGLQLLAVGGGCTALLGLVASLLRKKVLVDVGKYTTLGDGNMSKKLVQLLIVANGELEMTRDDTRLLVVTSGVTSQFENFSGEVLENSGEVDRGTGTDTLGVVALAEETVDTTDGESQTGLGRARLSALVIRTSTRLATTASCRLATSHFVIL
jgi:hypothetical protein